jgi:NADH-quinone oxidoreductase subunit J
MALMGALCLVTSPSRAVFLVVSGLGVVSALGSVLARNLVHAASCLVAFFFLVACQFVLLEVDFLAAVQVLLYIGAVAILLMFGIMLTRDIQGEERRRRGRLAWLPAAAVALGLMAMLTRGILGGVGPDSAGWRAQARPALVDEDGSLNPRGVVANNLGVAIGQEMLGRWVVPFEVAALLLTAALVGAVALAMGQEDEGESYPRAGRTFGHYSSERTFP